VIFQGRAYPDAFLTLLKNGAVAATFQAAPSGIFEQVLTGVRVGTYVFEILAEDTEGRQSVPFGFTLFIPGGTTATISRIFIPPTISISETEVRQGETISITGQAFPKSQVTIFIDLGDIIREAIADLQGKWNVVLDTVDREEGMHTVKAKALFFDGEQTEFSQTLSFFIVSRIPVPAVCQGADLNFDGVVDLIDFSILLFFWQQDDPENVCADMNGDGIVDIIDFSIMMFFWTG